MKATISGVVIRTATIAGLYLFAALMVLCAAGYGLNALYSYLAFWKGAVAASLWIAGGLAIVAIICGAVAYYLGKKPRPSQPVPWARAALLSAPTMAKLSRSPSVARMAGRVKLNSKIAAAAGGVMALGIVIGRRLLDSEPEA